MYFRLKDFFDVVGSVVGRADERMDCWDSSGESGLFTVFWDGGEYVGGGSFDTIISEAGEVMFVVSWNWKVTVPNWKMLASP